jgi:hypothetical protein
MTVSDASNSQTAVESLVSRCNESLQRGKQSGLASLEAHRDAGAALRELKELLPRGQFGSVAQARCGCSKQWRACLIKLDCEWDNIEAARRWAETNARELLRRAYSVDGALVVLKAWRQAQNGDPQPKQKHGPRKPRSPSAEREIADLKQRVSAAVNYIAVLEEELAGFTGTASTNRHDLDDSERRRVQKVAMLWLQPGTNGEGSAAAHKLRALARRLNWPLGDLLQACEFEGPVDWTFTSAP